MARRVEYNFRRSRFHDAALVQNLHAMAEGRH